MIFNYRIQPAQDIKTTLFGRALYFECRIKKNALLQTADF